MKAAPTALPSHAFAFLLWFSTLLLGSGLLTIYLRLAELEQLDAALGLAIITGLFASFLSLPTLLLLPFGLRWAFDAAPLTARWLRLLLVLAVSGIVATYCGYRYFRHIDAAEQQFMLFVRPYLLAAILAAVGIYHPWLFRP